jgi:hypothetical protein
MNRTLFPALLVIAAVLFSQHVRADALSTPESESALVSSSKCERSEPDEAIGRIAVIDPEEPSTLFLLTIGILLLVGIGQRSRIAHYLKSLVFRGGYKYLRHR